MKLMSCHIENFGKLRDCSMNFEENLNVICKKNGWGKSTFAAFIRAMFYGLEGERKRSIEENERKRYKPWQGGIFGGQLVFEENGRRYEISRIFQDKEANDEFELRDADTNLISDAYSSQIGEELFGVGRESFLRSIYIGQSACDTYATDDISAKIGNITDNTNDLNNYENADIRLGELMNKMTPSRKTGSIAKRKEEIAQLERQVLDGQGIGGSLEEYQKMLEKQENQYRSEEEKLQEMTALQKKVAAMQSILAKQEEWEHLKKTAQDKKAIVDQLQSEFPGEIPTMEEMRQALLTCGEEEKIRERVKMTRLSEEEKKEVAALDDCFQQGIPDERELDAKVQEVSQYRKLLQEYNQDQLSSVEQQRYEQLESAFHDENEPVSVIIGKWNERNNRKAAIPSKQATVAALKNASQERMKRNPVVLGIGIVALIIAGLLCIRSLWIPGILVLFVGTVIIGIGCRGSEKKEVAEQTATIKALEQEIAQDQQWITQTDTEVKVYLDAHGKHYDEYMAATLLQQIMEESVEYHALQKKKSHAVTAVDEKQLADRRQSIVAFLQRYQQTTGEDSYEESMYALQTKVQRYQTLAQQESRQRAALEEQKTAAEQLTSFLQSYGYVPATDCRAQLNELQEVVQQYYYADANWKEAVRTLLQFEEQADTGMLEKNAEEKNMPSLEELNDSISVLTQNMQMIHKTITEYQKTLENLGMQYDEWEDKKEQLEQLEEIQKEEQQKFHYLKQAKTKLSQAKESLTSRYTDPVLTSFEQYYISITGQDNMEFHIDANITVTVKEQGKQRDVRTLSTGYQDLVGICLRLAFVDAMYEQESPMLILDDPFTNLDDDKVIAARTLLQEVAKKYQVIYFTCSDARSM